MLIWLNFFFLPLIARLCLVVLFPFSALDKIVHWRDALHQIGPVPRMDARVLLISAIVVECVTPVCIVVGWHNRLAAFILAGFCVITAVLYHPFWRYADFWRVDSVGRAHFWDFLKNFGLVGGLLLVVLGADLVPGTWVVEHPLSSSATIASPRISP